MPQLQASTSSNASHLKTREEKQFNMLYDAEIMKFITHKKKYTSNLGNTYAFLFNQCNKALQSNIQVRKDFETKVKNNPIISHQENQYEMSVTTNALCSWVNL